MITKTIIKNLMLQSGILKAMTRLTKWRIVILRYHSIQEEPGKFAHSIGSGIIHSAVTFEKHMAIISKEYHPITIDDVLFFLLGSKTLPRRCVAVTFDDGFEDNFTYALPILEKFGIKASFYITVNSIENQTPLWFCRLNNAFANIGHEDIRRSDPDKLQNAYRESAIKCACLSQDGQNQTLEAIENDLEVRKSLNENNLMMNWDQLRKIRQMGHIVGSHSLSHPNLAHIEKPLALREMAESKKILEVKLGEEVVHFSYPGPILEPHYSKETISLTEQVGYKTAVTSTWGVVGKNNNPLALKRVTIPHEEMDFRWTLENALVGRTL